MGQIPESQRVVLPLFDEGDRECVGPSVARGVVGSGFEDIACASSCGYSPGAPKRSGGVGALEHIVQAEFNFGHRDIVPGGSADRNSRIAVDDTASCRQGHLDTRRNLIINRE